MEATTVSTFFAERAPFESRYAAAPAASARTARRTSVAAGLRPPVSGSRWIRRAERSAGAGDLIVIPGAFYAKRGGGFQPSGASDVDRVPRRGGFRRLVHRFGQRGV